jgi:alkylated DNA repair dioxygenase AlkB
MPMSISLYTLPGNNMPLPIPEIRSNEIPKVIIISLGTNRFLSMGGSSRRGS